MMRWGMLALCLLIPAAAFGQQYDPAGVSTSAGEVKPANAVRITLGGEFRLALVARNDALFQAALGDAVNGSGAPGLALVRKTGGSTGTGGDVFFDPLIALNVDAQLAEHARAFFELSTPFYQTSTRAGGSPTANRDLEVTQAYAELDGYFDPNLTLRFGIQDFVKDFTGRGQPFLLDVSHSESPFKNPGNLVTTPADVGTPQNSSSGAVGSQEAAGLWGKYAVGDLDVEAFYFTIAETFNKSSDDVLYGVTLEHGASKTSHLGATVFVMENGAASRLWTLGGGGYTQFVGRTIKIYGELYTQFGRYGRVGGRKIKQRGAFALYGGVRYAIPIGGEETNAYLDASYWELSGDDNASDFNSDAWVSFENNNDTVVMEDGYYGLDVDTNYRAIKLRSGFTPIRQVTVEGVVAFFEMQDNNGTADGATSHHDRLGTELDGVVNYRPTDNLVLRLRSGWLFDAKALGLQEQINVTVAEAAINF